MSSALSSAYVLGNNMDPTPAVRLGFHDKKKVVWLRGYKTFSMLNSAEHKIYPAHKC